MAPSNSSRKVNKEMIEENLKKAFADKAKEDVPDTLLSLLAQLKAQDEADGRG